MNKKLKIFLLFLTIICVVGAIAYNYIMHGGARNIANEKTSFNIDCEVIKNEFSTNFETANTKYIEKAIEVSGTISAVNDSIITLNNSVICNFKTPNNSLKTDQKVIIKGRVIGYDDLLGELQMDNCYFIR